MKSPRKAAPDKAWETMRGEPWKAHRSERLSKEALEKWAQKFGFRIVFLDAAGGRPRTGIADALMQPLLVVKTTPVPPNVEGSLRPLNQQRQQFRTTRQGMAMIIDYGIVMLGICMLGCVVPTRRALNIEPTIALRTE